MTILHGGRGQGEEEEEGGKEVSCTVDRRIQSFNIQCCVLSHTYLIC